MKAFWIVGSVILIVAGACAILWPRGFWQVTQGWEYKNLEPSDAGLAKVQFGGGVCIVLGLVGLAQARDPYFF